MPSTRTPTEIKADLALIERLRSRLQTELTISEKRTQPDYHYKFEKCTKFKKNQLVYIANEITVPSDTIANENDRFSIVRRVEGSTVYITTRNGLKTWRYAKNLRKAIKVYTDSGQNQ